MGHSCAPTSSSKLCALRKPRSMTLGLELGFVAYIIQVENCRLDTLLYWFGKLPAISEDNFSIRYQLVDWGIARLRLRPIGRQEGEASGGDGAARALRQVHCCVHVSGGSLRTGAAAALSQPAAQHLRGLLSDLPSGLAFTFTLCTQRICADARFMLNTLSCICPLSYSALIMLQAGKPSTAQVATQQVLLSTLGKLRGARTSFKVILTKKGPKLPAPPALPTLPGAPTTKPLGEKLPRKRWVRVSI